MLEMLQKKVSCKACMMGTHDQDRQAFIGLGGRMQLVAFCYAHV